MGWTRYLADAALSAGVSFLVGLLMPEGQKEEVKQEITGNEKVIINNKLNENSDNSLVYALVGVIAVLTAIILYLCLCKNRKNTKSAKRVQPALEVVELGTVPQTKKC